MSKITDLLDEARKLRAAADKLEDIAQAVCSHKKEDGSFNVYVGFPIAQGEHECGECRLPACYIKGWKL